MKRIQTHVWPKLFVGCSIALLAACSSNTSEPTPGDGIGEQIEASEGTPEAAPEANTPQFPDGHTPIRAQSPPVDFANPESGSRDAVGGVTVAPDPEAGSRNLRRMSVEQLQNAITSATGGLYWSDDRGADLLEALAPTLGVPNYIDTTSEDLEPSLVFQKFLGDAARSVCHESITNDLDMAPDDRVMLRYVSPEWTWDNATADQKAEIDRNLRYMKLRITGHYVAEGDEDGIHGARWLLRSVTHATGDSARGWRAVCVALMTSPEFYLY